LITSPVFKVSTIWPMSLLMIFANRSAPSDCFIKEAGIRLGRERERKQQNQDDNTNNGYGALEKLLCIFRSLHGHHHTGTTTTQSPPPQELHTCNASRSVSFVKPARSTNDTTPSKCWHRAIASCMEGSSGNTRRGTNDT